MDIFDVVIMLGICFAFCLLILWTYTLGLRNGQRLTKKEEVTLPDINPISVVNTKIEEREMKKEQRINELNWANIDNYDGSGLGQVNIPD